MRTLSRRRFLNLLAVFSVAAWQIKLSQNHPSHAQNGESVLVIGAGMAGLGAALRLREAGYNVTILEGRDRIGGRVWTDRSLKDLPLDMGASWIHGIEGNPLTDLVQKYGIQVVPTDSDNTIVYRAEGDRVDNEIVDELQEAFDELMDEVYEYGETLDEDIPLGTALRHVLDEWDLSDEERHALLGWANISIEHEYAATVDDLSLWWWDSDGSYGEGDVLFPGGYGQIVDQLAKGLDIRLNHVVQAVEYDEKEGVTITTSQGIFEADYAVITLPLGVLKSQTVRFDPPLPEAKQAAIRNLGTSVLNKVYLHFPDVFWDKTHETIVYLGERLGEWAETINFYAYTQQPVLLLFNAAEFGLAIEAMSDEQIVQKAMAMLRTVYGENIPDPDGVFITRWGKDPFAMGSYSSIYHGATMEDREALAESVADVLFFAGEATSVDYAATVHGALLSGQRAAKELIENS